MKKYFFALLIFMTGNQLYAAGIGSLDEASSLKPIKILPRCLADICVTASSSPLTVRPFQDSDITGDFVKKQFTYDPTDPMDKPENYKDAPPPIEELQAGYRELYSSEELIAIPFGIFTDTACVGWLFLNIGRRFCNAVEINIKIFPEFRGKRFASLAFGGFLNDLKRRMQGHPECDIFFVEAAVNSSNDASRRMVTRTGMRVFDDSCSYYFPLTEGDHKPLPMPQVKDPE